MIDDTLFDFPCSETFRRYEDHLLGRESPPRSEKVRVVDIPLLNEREFLAQQGQRVPQPPATTKIFPQPKEDFQLYPRDDRQPNELDAI